MTKTEVAQKESTAVTSMDGMYEDSEALGYSENPDDALVPILGILQDNSGEVKKKHERYIDGAEAGHMIIRSLGMTFEGEEDGVVFQPCGFSHIWVEWEGDPGEGRPVNQYDFSDKPSDVREVEKPDGGVELVLPNGNRIVETRNHFGFVIPGDGGEPIPMVIPMSGSNHQASKKWTLLMKQQRHNGRKAPAFANLYRIQTVFSQKGQQTWYKYKIKKERGLGEDDMPMITAGYEFAKAVSDNTVKADLASGEESGADSGDIPI